MLFEQHMPCFEDANSNVNFKRCVLNNDCALEGGQGGGIIRQPYFLGDLFCILSLSFLSLSYQLSFFGEIIRKPLKNYWPFICVAVHFLMVCCIHFMVI